MHPMVESGIGARWDNEHSAGRWEHLHREGAELDRLQIAAGWIRHFGARRVLDIGCGKGQLLAALDPTAIESYIGVDASSIAIAGAIRRPGVAAQFLTIEVQSEEIPPEIAADCICLVDVLYYFAQPADTLRKLFRSLSPGGFVIVCMWVDPVDTSPHNEKTRALWSIIDEVADTVLNAVQLTSGLNGYIWRLEAFRPRRSV
jgi:SAM-dependent methyltransferase